MLTKEQASMVKAIVEDIIAVNTGRTDLAFVLIIAPIGVRNAAATYLSNCNDAGVKVMVNGLASHWKREVN